jgi:hypothetical protein
MIAKHPLRAIAQTSCPCPNIKGEVRHNIRRLVSWNVILEKGNHENKTYRTA